MTPSDIGVFASLGLSVAGGLRWLLALQGRIDAVRAESLNAIASHEKTCDERMRRLDERHDSILAALHDIKDTLKGGRP